MNGLKKEVIIMRVHKKNWYSELLKINFNHKEWRQDLAAYIRKRCNWDFAVVSKARKVPGNKSFNSKTNKWFEFYDNVGRYVKIVFKNESEIISIEPVDFDKTIIDDYFEFRNMK